MPARPSPEEFRKRKELMRHLRASMESLRACISLFSGSTEPELHELIYHAGMTVQKAARLANIYDGLHPRARKEYADRTSEYDTP